MPSPNLISAPLESITQVISENTKTYQILRNPLKRPSHSDNKQSVTTLNALFHPALPPLYQSFL